MEQLSRHRFKKAIENYKWREWQKHKEITVTLLKP